MTHEEPAADGPGRPAKETLAALLAVALLAPPAAGLAALAAAPDAGLILVVAPPWADLAEIVADAGGRTVGPALGASAALATSPDPDFPSRLGASGAWLALDGDLIAQFCGAEA